MSGSNIKIDREIYEEFKSYCKANNLIIKSAIQEAIQQYQHRQLNSTHEANKPTNIQPNELEVLKVRITKLEQAVFDK